MTTTLNNKILKIQAMSFWVIISSIIVLSVFYLFFTAFSAVNVAEREILEDEVLDTRGKAVTLELLYMDKAESITLESAKEIGFVEKAPNFVSRKSSVARVTLNNEN